MIIDKLSYKDYSKIEDKLFSINDYTNEKLSEYNLKILSATLLKKNKFYIGNCRNSSEAFWDGKQFHYIRMGWSKDDLYIESINHQDFEKHECADVFSPFALLTTIKEETKLFFKKEGFEMSEIKTEEIK